MIPHELKQVLWSLHYPYCDEDWLDPREAFECGLAENRRRLPAALEQWRALKADAATEEDFVEFNRRLHMPWLEPAEGISHRRWAEWAEHRMVEAIARPETLLPEDAEPFHPRLFRGGEFRDATAETLLVQELITRYESEVGAWLAHPDAGLRLHLLADVGWRVGDATVLGETDADVIRRLPTCRGAVALLRTPGADLPMRALAAYPVDPQDPPGGEAYRRRWPELQQLFGGYFGQHGARWQWPWGSQRALLMDEPPAFLDAVRQQLPELLSLGDAALRCALEALGCYVEPPHVRAWLERMLWRMEAFDWR